MPSCGDAGNVVRPSTKMRLSFRLCPALDAEKAKKLITELLTKNVPYNCKVTLDF